MSDAAVAMNRFGLGATRGQEPPGNPKRWLLDQIDAYQPATPVLATAPTSTAVAEDIAAYQAEQRAIRQAAMAKQGAPAPAAVVTPPPAPAPAMTPMTATMAATVMAPPSPAQEKRIAQQVARQDARRLAQDESNRHNQLLQLEIDAHRRTDIAKDRVGDRLDQAGG